MHQISVTTLTLFVREQSGKLSSFHGARSAGAGVAAARDRDPGQEMPMTDGVFDPSRRLAPRSVDAAPGGSLSLRRLREIEAVLGSAIDPAPAADPGAAPGLDGGRALERDSIELLRAFNQIADPEARRDVLRLVLAAAREAEA
jgi:hypothetical protein